MTTHHQTPDELSEFAELLRHEEEFPVGREPVDRDRRRRRRRRGLLITAIVLALTLAASGGYVGWALSAPLSAPVLSSQTPAAPIPFAATIAVPVEGISAVSVAGADEYLGAGASDVWMTSGTDETRPIASISKLITALVVLD